MAWVSALSQAPTQVRHSHNKTPKAGPSRATHSPSDPVARSSAPVRSNAAGGGRGCEPRSTDQWRGIAHAAHTQAA